MIAKISFQDGPSIVSLVLDDDGVWHGPMPWSRSFNAIARASSLSPSKGAPYVEHVEKIAKIIGAKVVYEEKKEPKDEVVY